MEISRQNQTAGDNSCQLQADNVGSITVVNGITEQRAREIFREMNEVARRDYTSDAYELALKRVSMFEELLMEKVQKVDGLLESFGDPAFQFLLADAQRHAAASERENDYSMLTELLGCRVKHDSDRKIRTAISSAVKIVDEVDDDALCSLTVVYFFRRMVPLAGMCSEGLDCLEKYAKLFLQDKLAPNNDWMEHLEILNAIRKIHFTAAPKFEEIFYNQLPGYVCVGIEKESDTYSKAMSILREAELPVEILVDHELIDGYVRLPVTNINQINELKLFDPQMRMYRPLYPNEITAIRKVWDLYSKDTNSLALVKSRFMSELENREYLKILKTWWNKMPMNFEITKIGEVLAHANAQRLDNTIPALF